MMTPYVTDPDPDIEPWSFDGGPKLPPQLTAKEQERTGHRFKGCPESLTPPDNKRAKREACPECAKVTALVKAEVEVWRKIQEAKVASWRPGGGNEPVTVFVADAAMPAEPTPYVEATQPQPQPRGKGPTDKMINWAMDMYVEQLPESTQEQRDAARARFAALSFADASAKLDAMKAKRDEQRKAAPKPQATSEVPDGYYAIESTGSNDLVFYRVTSSEKWGKSVQMIVGGHTDTFVARRNVPGILARIGEDTLKAAKRYAEEYTRCYRCNRQLTDQASRAAGIGPECATKF